MKDILPFPKGMGSRYCQGRLLYRRAFYPLQSRRGSACVLKYCCTGSDRLKDALARSLNAVPRFHVTIDSDHKKAL